MKIERSLKFINYLYFQLTKNRFSLHSSIVYKIEHQPHSTSFTTTTIELGELGSVFKAVFELNNNRVMKFFKYFSIRQVKKNL